MKVKCHICKSVSNNLTKLKSVSLHYCNECNHRFTDVKTIINPEKYKPEYFSSTHSNWFENPDYVLYKNLTEFFKKKFKRKFSVLDIGCGNGNFLKYLSKNIKEVSLTGIDHHKNKKHQRINFLQGNIEKNKKLKKYDVVASNMVIEHIEDVNKFILIQKKLCKKNGYIINNTINESSLLYKIARIMNKFYISKPMEMLYDKHHLNHFSINSLVHLYKRNKLNNLKIELSQFNIHALTLPSKNFFIKNIFKFLILCIYLIEKIFKNTNQQTIICKNN